ncbi:hypothetical protein BOX15_Mlig011350g3 [Macrostomum lignano]|uniref:Uncharacterized protein n=2 Tax=Macrostomum lignano TaxID=282301 RepID=A0A267EXP9_9PLAT|nr:hypothetical protein BOX15_Mlig011350g1 [Macrostomum lignano]PAA81899.1 hypothetical protein BOX15_Mlig011350g2 [Macrostomum lignano]PAA91205.1 hypothetical protein BOX15_Mlig011350g3 [Macrostomum lignano]
MADTHEIDPLFEVKNNFYLGNYQQCINECQKVKTADSQLTTQRDAFLYRAYIGQRKYAVVLDAVNRSSAAELQSVRLLADYLASPDKRPSILASLNEKMSGSLGENDYISLLMAATVFLYENDSDSALRLLHQTEHIECLALAIQTLLSIDRPDVARKELARMQAVDEDSTLTQLATAQVGIHSGGGEKLQDAFYAYQELIDKYGSTSSLLNGKASALMCLGRWEEAEPVLQEALDKDCNHPDTLVNMIVLSQHLGKEADVCGRYVSQLKDSYRSHPWVQDFIAKEAEFDKISSNYRESVASN